MFLQNVQKIPGILPPIKKKNVIPKHRAKPATNCSQNTTTNQQTSIGNANCQPFQVTERSFFLHKPQVSACICSI